MDSFLGDTQTPRTGTTAPESQILPADAYKAIWGRLYPIHIHLDHVDLNKNTFSVGRAPDCDIILTENVLTANKCQVVSKMHFIITKDVGCPPYITDLSKNGTFLNGVKIGKGKKNILQHNDEISVGIARLKAYCFLNMVTEENVYLPPELQKKYEPSKVLGTGACGEVKLLFDKVTCQRYAVKKIVKANVSKVNSINHINRIRREVEIMKGLSHPCIVKMKEIVETDEAVFIVLEYLEGGELTDYISCKNPLKEDQAKFLFHQIVLAVKYLHSKGIAHRDLKPGNVLLSKANPCSLIKLTDFGLSKLISDRETVLRTVCGTPCYVAPEVLDRKVSCYDLQVDIWSMGVLLYYMLSQELPFTNTDKNSLTRAILKGIFTMDSESWDDISEEAKDLLTKMLVVDPEERITVREILKHPWLDSDAYTKKYVHQLIYENQETRIAENEVDVDILPPQKRRRTESLIDNTSIET